MGLYKSKFLSFSALFLCVTLGLVTMMGDVTNAQDSQQDYLNGHNAARSEVNVAELFWNESVAAYANNYANERKGDCNLVHSDVSGIYGENIAMSTGDMSGIDAVKMWVDEKVYYDYNYNSCADGEQCGHYTQVVWNNTISIGCAKVTCDNGGTFITCKYYPPGNYYGEKPY